MQIKTVKNRLDNNETFDKEVNQALSEGYVLVKRMVLTPNQPTSSTTFLHTMLYAELVKSEPEDVKEDLLGKFRADLMDEFINVCNGDDYNKIDLLSIGKIVDHIFYEVKNCREKNDFKES